MMRDPEVEAWVERARKAEIRRVLDKVASTLRLKWSGKNGVGPCPACGGKDRFSINGSKNSFWCRKSQTGGDAIALVEYVTGANFLGAVEIITGESMPQRKPGEIIRREDPALVEQRRLAAEAEDQRREQERLSWRDHEVGRAREIWGEGEVLMGTVGEDYLRSARGVQPPPGARLRFHPALKYWHCVKATPEAEGKWRVLHVGPALLARVDDNAHRFMACHCTWLDLSRDKGKAEVVDPSTGEVLDAKKVRGSQKGGHIHLGGSPATATRLVMGEGTETTLTAREALVALKRDVSDALFWAGVNIGNIGGPHAGSIPHPTLTTTDKLGRVRKVKVAGPVPDLETKQPVLLPPDGIRRVTLLGDGDSERFATEQHYLRGAARWAKPERLTEIAWAPKGRDLNNIIMGQAA